MLSSVRMKNARYRSICFATRIAEDEREMLPHMHHRQWEHCHWNRWKKKRRRKETVTWVEGYVDDESEVESAEPEDLDYHQYVRSVFVRVLKDALSLSMSPTRDSTNRVDGGSFEVRSPFVPLKAYRVISQYVHDVEMKSILTGRNEHPT